MKNSVGFEYFRKDGNEFGDFLTSDLQTRLSYDSSGELDEDWAVEVHNAWVDYKLGLGKNLRVGHFAPAFGLEPVLNTHSSLLKTLADDDIGFNRDWGVGWRGGLGAVDCQTAVQTGSGMGLERRDGSVLTTARIEKPKGATWQWGLSGLWGEVLESEQMRTIPEPDIIGSVSKKRIGSDLRCNAGPFLVLGELTFGRDDDRNVLGALLELGYVVPDFQAVTMKIQERFWSDNPGNPDQTASGSAFSASYNFSSSLTLTVGTFHDWEKPDGGEDTQVFLQMYYFGK